jgi:HlyD family secretion protein
MRFGMNRRRFAWLAGVLCTLPSVTARAQFGPAVVKVAPVEQTTVSSLQSFSATVMPGKKAIIGSAVEGRVMEYLVEEGDFVKSGQPLAQLRTGTIEIELAGAEAELSLRKAELTELKNGSRPDEIAEAEARMNTAKTRADFAKSRLRRQSTLLERKAIPQDDYDDAVTAAAAAEHQLREVEAHFRLVSEGPRKEKIAQKEAEVKQQEEAVNHIRDRMEKFTVRAYFDGYVTEELTEVGHWIKSGEAVVEVCRLDEIEIRVMVLEDYVPYLKKGTAVPITVAAMPGQTFKGDLKTVVPQADVRSRTFPVVIRAANVITADGPQLKAGMLAQVTLPVGQPHQGLVVPKDAVVLGGPEPLVFVVVPASAESKPGAPAGKPDAAKPDASGKTAAAAPGGDKPKGDKPKTVAMPVPVKLGMAEGGRIEVKGDLKPGMQVVVQGNERLRPGAEVVVSP